MKSVASIGTSHSEAETFNLLATIVDAAGPALTSAERAIRWATLNRDVGALLNPRMDPSRFQYELPGSEISNATVLAILEQAVCEATQKAVVFTLKRVAEALGEAPRPTPPRTRALRVPARPALCSFALAESA